MPLPVDQSPLGREPSIPFTPHPPQHLPTYDSSYSLPPAPLLVFLDNFGVMRSAPFGVYPPPEDRSLSNVTRLVWADICLPGDSDGGGDNGSDSGNGNGDGSSDSGSGSDGGGDSDSGNGEGGGESTPVPVPLPDIPPTGETTYGAWYYVYGAAGEPVYFAVAWDVSNVDGEVTYRARVAYDAGANSASRSGNSGWGVYNDASAYIAAQLGAFLAALAKDGSTGLDNPPGGDDGAGVPPEYSTYWYWMAPPYGRGELEAQFIGGRSWETYLREFVKDGYEKVSGMAEGAAKIEAFRAWVYHRAYTSIHVIFGFIDDTGVTNATTGKTYYYDISSKRYEMFERRARYWLRVYRDLGGPWQHPSTRAVVRGRSKRGW